MAIGATCTRCQRIHYTSETRAEGLFHGGPVGYRSVYGGPWRQARAQAQADVCEHFDPPPGGDEGDPQEQP